MNRAINATSGGSQNSPIAPFPPRLKILQLEISGFRTILIVEVQKNVEVATVHVNTIGRRYFFVIVPMTILLPGIQVTCNVFSDGNHLTVYL